MEYKINEMRKHKQWFVAYTYPKAEKKIQSRIQELGIECFLPLNKVKRKWSDRIKIIEAPLFPSYLFVYTVEKQIPQILFQIKEIVWFVSFEKKLATVREEEIEFIRRILVEGKNITVEEKIFREGEKVIINKGPFLGLEGILVKEHSKKRFILELEGLQQSLSIDIPTQYLSLMASR